MKEGTQREHTPRGQGSKRAKAGPLPIHAHDRVQTTAKGGQQTGSLEANQSCLRFR